MELEKNRMESNSFVEKVSEMGKIENGRLTKEENNSKPSSPNSKDPSIIDSNSRQSSSNQKDSSNQEDQLESAKAEMGEVREENERLKTILAKIVKDYQALQMQFFDIVQQEQAKKPTETASIDQEMEEPELVSLSLGSTAGGPQKKEKTSNLSKIKDGDNLNQGLSLGLDCKFEGIESSRNQISPENSFEESKEEEVAEAWPPSKAMKMARSGEDDVSQQTHVKKTRVSVRTRCEAPTMNDGCQWRKYGQKIAKGNPCPRAYYRCTVAPACPVRKQVQRCAEDMSILITTYEGTHNHPLPISATAMASTTSAAAYMLASGSSTSQPSSFPADHRHGLNFSLSDPSGLSKPFFLQNQSISSSPYPTITLDLTSPSPSSSQFSRFAPNSHDPRHSSSSSSTFNFASDPNTYQNSWSNSYGSQNYNKNPIGSSRFLPNSTDQQLYQSSLQRPNFSPQQSMTETVAAATKAITSDPSFRSALVAAITSIVGGGSGGSVENVDQNLKWSETFSTISSYSSSANGNIGCGSSYLNRASASTSNSQSGNLMFLPPALPFSSAKNASASPVDNRENIS